MTQPASLEAAGKIAQFFRLPGLQDRIERVREEKSSIGRREAEEGGKREGKWNHLVDLRTVVASSTASSSGLPPSSFMSPAVLGRQRLAALDSTRVTSSGGGGSASSKSKKRTIVANVAESMQYGTYEDDEGAEGDATHEGDSMEVDQDDANGERNGSNGISDNEERASKRIKSDAAAEEAGAGEGGSPGDYGDYEEEEPLEYAEEDENTMAPPPAKKRESRFSPRMFQATNANITTSE